MSFCGTLLIYVRVTTIKYKILPSMYFMYESFVILLSLFKNFLFQVYVCSYSLFTSLRDMTSEFYQRRSRSFLFQCSSQTYSACE